MTAERDLAPAVDAWLHGQARELPDHVRRAVAAALDSTPQRRRHRWPPLPTVRRATFAFLIAALLVAVVGSMDLLRLLSDPSVPIVGTRPDAGTLPTLGTDIPAGVLSGILETPLGAARWVHLTGDASTLPLEAPFARDSMFVALEERRSDQGDLLGRSRWTSPDGLRWTPEPMSLPIGDGFARFLVEQKQTWLTTTNPTSLWRSSDQMTWEPVDLGGILPVGPPALQWQLEIGTVASAGSLTAVEVILRADDPIREWPGDPSRVREVEPGLFFITGRGGDTPPRQIRFEETPQGLRVTDEVKGTQVAMLDGFTLDIVRAWATNGPPVQHLVARVDGDRLVPTSPDGPVLGDPDVDPWVAMVGTPDGIVALALRDPGGPAIAWRLDARGAWTELGPWDIIDGGPGGTFYLGSAPQSLHGDGAGNDLYANYDGPGTPIRRSWRSSDGLHWRQVLDQYPRGLPMAVASGYLELQWVPEPRTWWASPDGSAWIPLDLSSIGLTPDLWGSPDVGDTPSSLAVVGDTAFITIDRQGQRDMWALSFAGPPG